MFDIIFISIFSNIDILSIKQRYNYSDQVIQNQPCIYKQSKHLAN